jgi:hypothetical protein
LGFNQIYPQKWLNLPTITLKNPGVAAGGAGRQKKPYSGTLLAYTGLQTSHIRLSATAYL